MAKARYSVIAVILHWSIAILILGQVAGGKIMHGLPNSAPAKFDLFQLHKSFGLTILALSLLRLAWRLAHRAPELPAAMPGWQKFAARGVHWAFYLLMIATPLAGWAVVSVSPKGIATFWFGLLQAPHLGFLGVGEGAEEFFAEVHEYFAYGILVLFVLHVGAALKHAFFDRDGVFATMAPTRISALIGIGTIFVALGAAALSYLQSGNPEPGQHAATEAASADAENCGLNKMPPNWIVDYGQSRLKFTGSQNGNRFDGAFAEFAADIAFDPNDLSDSWVRVNISTGSGVTGDELIDATIGGEDWFATDDYPDASFVACDIEHAGQGYVARGELSIKGLKKQIALPFTIEIENGKARAQGGTDLMRTDFDLGAASSWLDDEGVAIEAGVAFEISAMREN